MGVRLIFVIMYLLKRGGKHFTKRKNSYRRSIAMHVFNIK